MSNELFRSLGEGAQMLGDLLLEAVTALGSALAAKAVDMGRGIQGAVGRMTNPLKAMKGKVMDAVSPSISPSKDKSPSLAQERSPAQAPEVPGPSKAQQYENLIGDLKLDSQSMGIEATDLGMAASVGHDGVGCAAHDAPRAAIQQQQQQEQSMMMQR